MQTDDFVNIKDAICLLHVRDFQDGKIDNDKMQEERDENSKAFDKMEDLGYIKGSALTEKGRTEILNIENTTQQIVENLKFNIPNIFSDSIDWKNLIKIESPKFDTSKYDFFKSLKLQHNEAFSNLAKQWSDSISKTFLSLPTQSKLFSMDDNSPFQDVLKSATETSIKEAAKEAKERDRIQHETKMIQRQIELSENQVSLAENQQKFNRENIIWMRSVGVMTLFILILTLILLFK